MDVNSSGWWGTNSVDLFALLPPTDDMRLRFVVQDGAEEACASYEEGWNPVLGLFVEAAG